MISTSHKTTISISLSKWNSRKWLQLNRSLYRLYKMSNSKMAIQIRSFPMYKVLINSQRRYAIFPQILLMRKRKNGLMWWPYSVEREPITTKQEYKLNPKPKQFIRKENIVIVSLMKTTILFKTSLVSAVLYRKTKAFWEIHRQKKSALKLWLIQKTKERILEITQQSQILLRQWAKKPSMEKGL